jgi:hypothetical protein
MENARPALFSYRRVEVAISQDEDEGRFSFQFTLGGKTIRGSAETSLIGIAARSARILIDQEIRKTWKDHVGVKVR